uniref:Uncharacterized protein n=1 Tax=Rhizophora mucronata TaxID=61149 RepID=A0A2P2MQ73_RHIMU
MSANCMSTPFPSLTGSIIPSVPSSPQRIGLAGHSPSFAMPKAVLCSSFSETVIPLKSNESRCKHANCADIPVNTISLKISFSKLCLRIIRISSCVQGAFLRKRRMSSVLINCWHIVLHRKQMQMYQYSAG